MKSITENEIEIFSRQLILQEFNEENFLSMQKKHVVIIGIGGVGCPVAQYLISTGIKNLSLVDNDIIKMSNLNRQILFGINTLGEKKVNVAKKKLRDINPRSKIKIFPKKITLNNISNIISDASIVIDTTDNWQTMVLINDYCVKKSIPLISCSLIGFDGQVILFNNKKNHHLCLNCIYPNRIEPNLPRCDTVGVLGTTAGLTGLIAAQLTINFFLNNHENTGKIIMIDTKTLKIEMIRAKKNEKCPVLDL